MYQSYHSLIYNWLPYNSLINAEYEYITLNHDVGETELRQGREIRAGGNLVYVDSLAVCTVKSGWILILEGVEKAERGIMPVCVHSMMLLLYQPEQLFVDSQQLVRESRNVMR